MDNRTVGFRVVGEGSSFRIENRMPGADANPYLAVAATLICGYIGIRDKIEPTQFNNNGASLGSPWKFQQYGQSGAPVGFSPFAF